MREQGLVRGCLSFRDKLSGTRDEGIRNELFLFAVIPRLDRRGGRRHGNPFCNDRPDNGRERNENSG